MVISKKGISAIVATVLIILITVAAVTIIWTTIIPMIQKNMVLDDVTVRLDIEGAEGYTAYDDDKGLFSVQVSRPASSTGDFDKMKVLLLFDDGNTYSEVVDAPEINNHVTYTWDLSSYFPNRPIKVSVSPIILKGTTVIEGSSTNLLLNRENVNIDPADVDYYVFGDKVCQVGTKLKQCGSSNVGVCQYGNETCIGESDSISFWDGICVGNVDAGTEVCDPAELDENCDGTSNEGCPCSLSDLPRDCGKVGACEGTQSCIDNSGILEWSDCSNPLEENDNAEICSGGIDEDCDGLIDEEDIVDCAACSGTASYVTTGIETCINEFGSGYTCDKTSNGITSDYWFGLSTGTPKWVYGDLGSKKCISGVRAYIYGSDIPQTMDIQVSDDAVSWTTVETGWVVDVGGTWVNKDFTEVQGKYVRFYITSCKRPYCNFRDFEIKSRSYSG